MKPSLDPKPPRDPIMIVIRLVGALVFAIICLAFRRYRRNVVAEHPPHARRYRAALGSSSIALGLVGFSMAVIRSSPVMASVGTQIHISTAFVLRTGILNEF
jgi:hypothetical protein